MAHTVTAATVAAWRQQPAPVDDELDLMDKLIAAVTEVIERDYLVDDPMTDAQEQAITMEVARLWERRNTPEGIGVFGPDGVIRVTREDLDVERLLQRKWGFA